MTDTLSQRLAILEYLKKGYTMTPLDGWMECCKDYEALYTSRRVD